MAPYTYTASAECAETGEEIGITWWVLPDLFEHNRNIGYVIIKDSSADMNAGLIQVGQGLSIEWMVSEMMPFTSSST